MIRAQTIGSKWMEMDSTLSLFPTNGRGGVGDTNIGTTSDLRTSASCVIDRLLIVDNAGSGGVLSIKDDDANELLAIEIASGALAGEVIELGMRIFESGGFRIQTDTANVLVVVFYRNLKTIPT